MRALLRSVWDEPRPADPPQRVWRDWGLLGVLAPLGVLEALLRTGIPWRATSTIVVLGLLPTLLWRRTRPLLMVAIAFLVLLALSALSRGAAPHPYVGAFVLLLPYALLRWGSGREAVVGASVVLVKAATMAFWTTGTVGDVVGGFLALSAMMALGAVFRYRSGARLREIDQIKLLERERLARDLHDTVAHHVSAIAVRAQAGLAMSPSSPSAATEALEMIATEASRTLTEMRTMVRVLRRDDAAELQPSAQLSDLQALADPGSSAAASADGPTVDVQVSGDVENLAPAVGAAVYRLAQESVTNARRHARHATRIEVRVTADERTVHLRVHDDGESNALRPSGATGVFGQGYGLVGMAERARLLGGECQAGPDPGRGWSVTATLPRSGTAGAAGTAGHSGTTT